VNLFVCVLEQHVELRATIVDLGNNAASGFFQVCQKSGYLSRDFANIERMHLSGLRSFVTLPNGIAAPVANGKDQCGPTEKQCARGHWIFDNTGSYEKKVHKIEFTLRMLKQEAENSLVKNSLARNRKAAGSSHKRDERAAQDTLSLAFPCRANHSGGPAT